MFLTKSKFIKIAAIASTVPEVSGLGDFGELSNVKIRRSLIEQTTSDLAFDAASRILNHRKIDIQEIGIIIFLSRTPDYRSPTTAAVLQGRLGLSLDCICYDVNRGSNGFMVGIQLVSSILANLNKKYGLVLFGDTPSKLEHEDTFFSSIESDAASAILLEKIFEEKSILSFHNSYGSHYKEFAILKGGFRDYNSLKKFDSTDPSNFKLTVDESKIAAFLTLELDTFLNKIDSLHTDTHQRFCHSQLGLLSQNPMLNDNRTSSISVLQEYGNTYGSNLPLQISSYFWGGGSQDPLTLSCISFGEGLELCYIRFEINPADIIETVTYAGFFDDYSVSHEM